MKMGLFSTFAVHLGFDARSKKPVFFKRATVSG